MASGTLYAPLVDSTLPSFIAEETNSLKFYLIDCDSGLMHLIVFPDETVMLFDCNLTEVLSVNTLIIIDSKLQSISRRRRV